MLEVLNATSSLSSFGTQNRRQTKETQKVSKSKIINK